MTYNRATQLIDFQLRNFVHARASTVGATAFDLVYLSHVEPKKAETLRGAICSLLHLTPADYASWKSRIAEGVKKLPPLDTSHIPVPVEGGDIDKHHVDHWPELKKKEHAWETKQARLPEEQRQPFKLTPELFWEEQQHIDLLRPHEWQLVDACAVTLRDLEGGQVAQETQESPHSDSSDQNDRRLLPDDSTMYDVDDMCGEGAYGQVFACRKKDATDDRRFALKIFAPGETNRLNYGIEETTMRELSIMTALQTVAKHEHTTMPIEGVYSDVRAMIMPLYKRSLDQILQSFRQCRQRMPLVYIQRVFCQVVFALERCHAIGVWHRDLKPSNIMVSDSLEQVVVADFGLSRIETDDRHIYTSAISTPEYLAPEVRHTHMYSSSNDIWSLGVILWEMITDTLLDVRRVFGPWRCTMRQHNGERTLVLEEKSRAKQRQEDDVRVALLRGCKRFSEAEQDELLPLLMACLQYDFDKRPTAVELQERYWFCRSSPV